MIINGKELILSPRKAKDVLDLAAACEGKEETNLASIVVMAQIINDSLRATGLKLSKFKRWRYTKFINGATNYILANLSANELLEAYTQVMEIEGNKKKVEAKERQSGEKSQED